MQCAQWYLILAACAMWGLYAGAYGPALAAIFGTGNALLSFLHATVTRLLSCHLNVPANLIFCPADSVITGKRSKIYTWRYAFHFRLRALHIHCIPPPQRNAEEHLPWHRPANIVVRFPNSWQPLGAAHLGPSLLLYI